MRWVMATVRLMGCSQGYVPRPLDPVQQEQLRLEMEGYRARTAARAAAAVAQSLAAEAALTPERRARRDAERATAEREREFNRARTAREAELLERAARYQQAVAMCEGQAAQVKASMYNPRSFLNLAGAIAGAQARNNCIAAIP